MINRPKDRNTVKEQYREVELGFPLKPGIAQLVKLFLEKLRFAVEKIHEKNDDILHHRKSGPAIGLNGPKPKGSSKA